MILELARRIDTVSPSPQLLEISQRLAKKDASIWGPGTEAATRLGWVDLPERSRALLPKLDALSARVRELGITDVVLSGMGGSSLAPEVIAKSPELSAQRELTILDSTEPNFVRSVLDRDLGKVLFTISSKSGTTIETLSHLAVIEERLRAQDLDARDHILIITDPNSALEARAIENSWSLLHGEPDVGGRFSALSAFGLAPAALIGVDISVLLDDASEMLSGIHKSAAKIATFLSPHRYLYFGDSSQTHPALAEWIEQLIAESTGKKGHGLLPIAIHNPASLIDPPGIDLSRDIKAPLGAQFILWEWVTALLGYLADVDPFDQPDVQATKTSTLDVLQEKELNPSSAGMTAIADLPELLISAMQGREYLAICAFLDPIGNQKALQLQEILKRKLACPVAFGWGPRFLHSTGQFHKGGPQSGLFLSLTIASKEDLAIPGKGFGFSKLIHAQAEGDRRALLAKGGHIISVHLQDSRDLEELIRTLQG